MLEAKFGAVRDAVRVAEMDGLLEKICVFHFFNFPKTSVVQEKGIGQGRGLRARGSCILFQQKIGWGMIPFLHLGWLTIPTFGLMVATALLVSAYVLQADFDRNRERFLKAGYLGKLAEAGAKQPRDEGFLIIGIAGIAGIVGARLYHVLESPQELMANPAVLISRFGFAWFGGFLGGFIALVILARHFRIPTLAFMDLCSPAAAVGYAIGRIGCLLSGDGDYGVPTTLPWGMSFPNGVVPTMARVHPTPLYEFLIWLGIAACLWQMGRKALGGKGAQGGVFCGYLVLTGITRFLIEFIRVNPRSILGMSNAQAASVISVVAGILLFMRIRASKEKSSETS